MKKTVLFILALVVTISSFAGIWDTEYQKVEKMIRVPQFCDKTVSIVTYGAKTTNTADKNQKAINKAIATLSKQGGGKVIIPAGEWKTGAIRMKSHVNLVAEKGATIKFSLDPDLYPLVETSWEGLDLINYSPFIYAYKETDVAVTGEGVFDGCSSNTAWWPMNGNPRFGFVKGVTTEDQRSGSRQRLLKMSDDGVPLAQRIFGKGNGLRPQFVCFNECDGVLIQGPTFLNSPFWVLHPLKSKSVTVKNVRVENDGPNGDGCDPESCDGVLIEDCYFNTGDDCIAIKSGRNRDGRTRNMASQNIIVRGCKMANGHGGVVIGSEISGGVKNVFVENCDMDSPLLERVIRLKTNTCRGGVTDGIYVRNIRVGQCKEAVLKINLLYDQNENSERGHIPTIKNVYLENVNCEKSQYGAFIDALDESCNVIDIHVKNCRWNGVKNNCNLFRGKMENVTFDNVMINGSLVLLEKPYKNYSEWMTYSEIKRNPLSWGLDFSPSKARWSYVVGIELESMLDTYLAHGGEDIWNYLKSYPAKMIDKDGNTLGYRYETFNLDNIRPARFILRMYEKDPQKGELAAIKTYFKQLENQPRTQAGPWHHKKIYSYQVWLDGIYMGLPFYTMAAPQLKSKKATQKVYDDAVNQIIETGKRTFDAKTGLWKHAWDERKVMFWANKETGLSQHSWARAMGWYVMAMVEVLDALPQDYARRGEVIDLFQQAMEAIVKYQDKKSKLWFDVLDVKDSRNYLEATASSMFTYCLLKGSRLGYLDNKYRTKGVEAYNAILNTFIRVNPDKTISLTNCCEVSGLGPENNPRRDGSFEYYMSEPIRDNDGKGVGPFIWASLEMERN